MVELSLAIAILVIATISIITLFFIGIDESKSSIGQNYSAIAADDMFAYISRKADYDWTSLLNDIPASKPDSELTNTIGWIINNGDIYQPSDSGGGVFGIKKFTRNSIEDFTAEVLIWQQGLNDWSLPGDTIDGYDVSGTIRCNPSSSGQNATIIYGTTLGTIILKDEAPGFTYNGAATTVKSRSQGTKKEVSLDNLSEGEDPLLNISGESYTFSSGDITVNIIKMNNSLAEITFDARNTTIVPAPGRSLEQAPQTSAAILIEISWPVTTDYNLREKHTYYFEIFDEENV